MKITFWLTMETTAINASCLTLDYTSHLMQILDSRIILISSLLYVLSPCPQPTETWSLLGHPEFVLNSMPVMSLTRTVSHTPSWPNFKSWWNLEVYKFSEDITSVLCLTPLSILCQIYSRFTLVSSDYMLYVISQLSFTVSTFCSPHPSPLTSHLSPLVKYDIILHFYV